MTSHVKIRRNGPPVGFAHVVNQTEAKKQAVLPEFCECRQSVLFEKDSRQHALNTVSEETEDHGYLQTPTSSLLHYTCLLVGAVYGLSAAAIAWVNGVGLLPMLAVYCAVGCATTLGTAVIVALMSSESYDLD